MGAAGAILGRLLPGDVPGRLKPPLNRFLEGGLDRFHRLPLERLGRIARLLLEAGVARESLLSLAGWVNWWPSGAVWCRADDPFVSKPRPAAELQDPDHRHTLLAGLSRKLRDNVIVRLRYGFFENDESSSGGLNNYRANLVSANCTVRF